MSDIVPDCDIYSHFISFTEWLKVWQTLFSGFIALAAALIGAYFLNRQTIETQRSYRDGIKRRHQSAKIMLIPVLYEISGAQTDVMVSIVGYHSALMENIPAKCTAHLNLMKSIGSIKTEHYANHITNFTETLNDDNEVMHVSEIFKNIIKLDSCFRIIYTSLNVDSSDFRLPDASASLIVSATISHLALSLRNNLNRNINNNFYPCHPIKNIDTHWLEIEKIIKDAFETCKGHDDLFEHTRKVIQNLKSNNTPPWTAFSKT